ncbi:MAG: glycosyltransferase family protein [Lachnospiraceae bacterium]|nr:glycosyltransferase family protein [Butyrivibrio sp.]MCM1342431.1 glycosyltransferase family protein [Muribaculaceae bacterium]MCM1410262.1 glycosyltransferase family protein [Lachnospiraceae bacterium]
MNDHKFAFILCTNDALLLEECVHYINQLSVPDGYEVDLLTIADAAGITQGYNEAMLASDARYKIYLHQDVFILNRYLLYDLLSVFSSDPQIGMIGMVGYEKISPDGIMWYARRSGGLYTRNPDSPYPRLADYRYSLAEDGYDLVACIDGFFMATCRDLRWNTDKLDGWDFYDAFQSIRFLSEGYKIAVPRQAHPWCMHDDNRFPSLFHYDRYRQIFMQAYPQFLGKSYREIIHFNR